MSRLAPSSGGAAAVHDRAFVLYDVKGARVAEQKLDKRAGAVARFGEEEWLVLAEKQKHLSRISLLGEPDSLPPTAFASGKSAINAFAVGRDDAVAVARGETMELWSRDGDRLWAAKGGGAGGPFTQAVVARDHVVALGEDGALYFFSRDKGDPLGALRLASPDPVDEWRLAHIDSGIVVLALGEWLVWIDAATRKTVRRVRARAKVVEITADVDHVAIAVEDGFVQAFRATSGEPRASFASTHEESLCAIALGGGALFTMGTSANGSDTIRACDRQTLDVAARAASPICALAVRGNLAAIGDRSGRVRLMEAAAGGGDLREVAVIAGASASAAASSSSSSSVSGEGSSSVGLFIMKNDTVVVAGSRVVMRVPPPWQKPLPMALRSAPTAFAADNAYAFAGTTTGSVDVYELVAGRHVTTYTLSSDDRITALLRLSGPLLVVGTGALDGRVLFVDVAESKVVHRVSPHEEAFGVTALASDARGRIVASGSDDGSVVLLDPVKGRVLARLRVNETPTSMAFEPSGRRLACAFADGTAAIATFAQKGATWSDLGLRGVTQVAWGESGLFFGFKDGHAETGERHARPSERPNVARQ